ncbi:hypothetical protein D3C81_1882820 [compost metagenome]
MGQLDPGDLGEGLGQHLGFVLVGGDGFRDHFDAHPAKRLRRLDEPLQLFELLIGRQGGRFEFTADPFLRGVFIGIGPGRRAQTAECQHGCQ